jgi:hypothetical protein
MSYSVTVNTDGPREPGYVLELAEAAAEIIRALNHITRDHAALRYPAEGDTLIRYLESAAERLPQLLDQVASWYEREAAAGRLRVVAGDWEGIPGMAVVALRMRADAGRMAAEQLGADLKSAAGVTTNLAAREDDSNE